MRKIVLLTMLAISLAFVPAARATACAPLTARICLLDSPGWASDNFGGADYIVNTDPEISSLVTGVTDMDRTLQGLKTDAERSAVTDRGLVDGNRGSLEATPTTTITTRSLDPAADETTGGIAEAETGGATIPASDLSRSYSGSRTYTFTCVHKSIIGLTVWRYNSRWTWGWSAGKVRWARHYEYASSLQWFWGYGGTHYLWPSGGIGQWTLGRAVQGTFTFAHGVVWTVKPILNVHVHGDGGAWYNCTT